MDRRRWTLGAALGLTALALVVLALGVSSLNFSAGKPLPRLDLFQWDAPAGTSDETSTGFEAVLRVLVGVVFWVLLPLSIVYVIVSPEARRRLWRNLVAVASFLLLAFLIYRFLQRLDISPPEELNPGSASGSGAGETRSVTPPDFVSHPPDWIILIASGIVFALIGLIIWRFWRQRASARAEDDDLQDDLVQQAEAALDAVRFGEDLSNAVLRCYREMEEAVQRSYGWHRRASMTPREFERRLINAGLDADAVRRLTRLFERVRYGHHEVGADDEVEAEACLAAIAGRTAVGEAS